MKEVRLEKAPLKDDEAQNWFSAKLSFGCCVHCNLIVYGNSIQQAGQASKNHFV